MEEEPIYEMKLTNGIGEQMLAHVFEKFDVELKQTEFGPKLQGTKEELEKAKGGLVIVLGNAEKTPPRKPKIFHFFP